MTTLADKVLDLVEQGIDVRLFRVPQFEGGYGLRIQMLHLAKDHKIEYEFPDFWELRPENRENNLIAVIERMLENNPEYYDHSSIYPEQ